MQRMQEARLGVRTKKVIEGAGDDPGRGEEHQCQYGGHCIGKINERSFLFAPGDGHQKMVKTGGQEQNHEIADMREPEREIRIGNLKQHCPGGLPHEGGETQHKKAARNRGTASLFQYIEAVTEKQHCNNGRKK